MKITKLQASVAKFASTSTIRPELACIKHDGRTTVATDTHRLVEITHTLVDAEPLTILASAKGVLKAKMKESAEVNEKEITVIGKDGSSVSASVVSQGSPDDFPKYDQLFKENEDDIIITVDGEYLASIAEALSALSTFRRIKIRVPQKAHAFITITSEGNGHTARALLAPQVA